MSQILRQSTQVVVRIGVCVAVGDGFTPVTTLTLSGADEAELLKAAGAATVSIAGNTFAAITGADGWYDLTLTTTDTNTIGTLDVVVNDDSLCLPIYARFQVIEEAAYDTIFAASALPASTTNITAGVVTTATNVTTLNGIAANVITAAATAADFGTEVAAAVWERDATASQTQGSFGQAIGDPAADTNSIYKAVVTDAAGATVGVDVVAVKAETASIQTDTNDLQTQIGAAGAGLTAINLPDQTMNITGNITGNLSGSVGSVTGAVGSVTGAVGSVTGLTAADVGAIKAKTDNLPSDPADASVIATATSAIQATVDDIPTNAELTTALADLPTNAELATALSANFDPATDEVLANVQKINNVTIVGDGSGTPFNV